jgi:hypothetical protein
MPDMAEQVLIDVQVSGVALLVINTDRAASHGLTLAPEAERYILSAKDLLDTRIELNENKL